MKMRKVSSGLAVSGQVNPNDLAELATAGIQSIICNRPDGEEPGQPTFSEIAAQAKAAGIEARHIPVGGAISAASQARAMAVALAELPQPVLAYCRTGNRSEQVAKAAAELGPDASRSDAHHTVVIVGGGSAGIATAASMLKRKPNIDLAIIEPREEHYYQPGFTMVGGGVFMQRDTVRPMADVMPRKAKWLRDSVATFEPERNAIVLQSGSRVTYDVLIVAVGNRLAWEKIDGLEATLGFNGVTSNYRYDLAPYTWQLVQEMQHAKGRRRAIFTQPPMPIKCAGAPQKAMYLACSEWEKVGALKDIDVTFHNAGAVLFGVPAYVPALMETVDRYGINLDLESNLVAVDGPGGIATFRTKDGTEITREFDMLHVVPPQEGNPVVAGSPIADSSGYVDVDPATLRHTRWPNIFGLGDGCNTGNAKTAAAARKQAPVVAVNALAALDGLQPKAAYDGYGSCPLTVDRGHIVLAEFTYGGKVSPTLPTWLIDGTRPSRLAWHLKADALPPIYWHGMLKGREWLVPPVPLQ